MAKFGIDPLEICRVQSASRILLVGTDMTVQGSDNQLEAEGQSEHVPAKSRGLRDAHYAPPGTPSEATEERAQSA
eukprot:12717064-Heterocapsa_arctica.AAC.1